MKRVFIAMIALLPLMLINCSDEDYEGKLPVTKENIVGEWVSIFELIDEDLVPIDETEAFNDMDDMSIQFKSNGDFVLIRTYIQQHRQLTIKGTWEFSNNRITSKLVSGQQIIFDVKEISNPFNFGIRMIADITWPDPINYKGKYQLKFFSNSEEE